MNYNRKDLVRITWTEFDKYMLKIKSDVQKYLDTHNLTIDLIVPILRGGGIPAIKLAFMFKALRILPIQYKYFNENSKHILKKIYNADFKNLVKFNNKKPVILVVEGNHSSGTIANTSILDIKKKMPNCKIIYVSLSRDYIFKDSVKGTVFDTYGVLTNESRKLSKKECDKLNIRWNKVFIFPWESFEEELAMLNRTDLNYIHGDEL